MLQKLPFFMRSRTGGNNPIIPQSSDLGTMKGSEPFISNDRWQMFNAVSNAGAGQVGASMPAIPGRRYICTFLCAGGWASGAGVGGAIRLYHNIEANVIWAAGWTVNGNVNRTLSRSSFYVLENCFLPSKLGETIEIRMEDGGITGNKSMSVFASGIIRDT